MNFLLVKKNLLTPIKPGVCTPPPTEPASVENFIPHGVISGCSLGTTITPPVIGRTATIVSKQPHEVIGSLIIEYALNEASVW